MRSRANPILAAVAGGLLAAAVALGGWSLAAPSATHTVNDAVGGPAGSSAATVSESPREIYDRTAPGVVAIEATSSTEAQGSSGFGSFFGQGEGSGGSEEQTDTGSGVVINRSGLILTNEHVVDGASSITVQVGGSGGVTRQATLVGSDNSDDLAVIKVSPDGLSLHPLTFGNSSAVEVGDTTVAIGNPFNLDQTLTTGVVSALDREIQAPDGAAIRNVIQTDAALNPGNSGGPLLDAAGQVIGVNSQIATGGSAESGADGNVGIGFAVPSNTIRSVLPRMEHGARIGADADQEQEQQEGGTVTVPEP